MDNDIVNTADAAKNGHLVVLEHPGVWYTAEGGITALGVMIEDLLHTEAGWGWDRFMKEANTGKGMKVRKWMRFYLTWVLPVLLALVFLLGILNPQQLLHLLRSLF